MIHQVSIPLYMKSPLSIKNIIQCNNDIVQEKRLQKQIFMMQKQYLPMLKEKTFHFTSKAPITNWHKTAGSWRKFTA